MLIPHSHVKSYPDHRCSIYDQPDAKKNRDPCKVAATPQKSTMKSSRLLLVLYNGLLVSCLTSQSTELFLWWYYEGSWLLLTLPFLFRMKFKLNGMIQLIFKFTYIYRGSWRDRRRQYCWSSLMSRYRNLTGVWRASASALTSSMWCSWASSSTSTPPWAPSSTRSCRPRTSSLCPPLRFVTNTSSQSKGLWLVSESYTYLFIYWLFNMILKGRIFPAREGEGEIRSAEIINCEGRKNGLSWHDLIVIFCDINYSIFILE